MKCFTIIIIVLPLIHGNKLVELLGAGASFPREVYAQWISLYRNYRIRHLNLIMKYESVGSGTGKTRIKANPPMIHYAGSDTPLSDADLEEHSDLIMFPTMAGSVVIAHNIPGIDELVLSLDVLVGIYSGKIYKWNDPLIANLNPDQNLPDEEIIPIVRADQSGTTSVFTSALSARSKGWNDDYGTFSKGYDSENRQPYYWNTSVIKFFGRTNQGISGLLMSLDYSLGYLSIADAYTRKLNVALMKNSAGNIVNASLHTVQNAMSSSNGSISIVNTPGEFAYPIASFTNFIVPRTSLSDCDAATEFVRYVHWFLSSDTAKSAATELFMVPLEQSNADIIVNTYLKTMTCRGHNVWQLVQEQIANEAILPMNEEWKVPTFISMSLFLAVLAVGGILFGRQQYKIHKALLKDEWRIPADAIDIPRQGTSEFHGNEEEMGDDSSTKDASKSHIVFIEHAWNDDLILMGSYSEQPVTLAKLTSQRPILTLKNRRLLLWMRDNIRHNNVMPFVGLTIMDEKYYTVHSGYMRGTLSEILKNPKIMIYMDGTIALMKSLIRGLHYLHKKGVIHGRLTGMCCYIDISWSLKIASWEENKIGQIDENNRVLSLVDGYTARDNDDDKHLLWTAPEILKFNRSPNQASDVYSFSMVLQEMFSRDTPYSELNMSVSEVVNAVLKSGIRPQFAPSTPFSFRMLMERCWDNDPDARSTLAAIETSVCSGYPKEKPLIDCIFNSVEQYARTLEDTVKDIKTDLVTTKEALEACLYRNVPEYIAEVLKTTGKYDKTESNACILVCRIACFDSVLQKVTSKGITNLMNHFYTGIDQLLLQNYIYTIHRSGIESSFIVGLQKHYVKSEDTARTAARIAMRLKQFTIKFGNERLQGMDVNLNLQIGIACGEVVVGVMDKSMPQLTVFGSAVHQASYLVSVSGPGSIMISDDMCALLQKTSGFRSSTSNHDGEIMNTLDGI